MLQEYDANSEGDAAGADAQPGSGLVVTGLTKRFGKTTAVDDLSFEVAPGQVVGLMGDNGAGKTTTLHLLAGMLRPDGGQITWAGRILGPKRGQHVMFVPEVPDIDPMLTVWEHLLIASKLWRLDGSWHERATELMDRFHLTEHRDKLGDAMSKGMKQKTLLATALLVRRPILLLDEPITGLDQSAQEDLAEMLVQSSTAGMSIVMSSHLKYYVERLCHRIVTIDRGRHIQTIENEKYTGTL
jgi:ABC-2 type transport system ATP-binding protein